MHVLAAIGWPVLDRVHIGSRFAVSPHGVGIALGYLAGSWWVLREGPKRGMSEEMLSRILFWALIGAIVGARLFYVIAHVSDFHSIGDVFAVYRGGISLLGGIAGAVLLAYPFMRSAGYRFLQVMDSASIGLAFGIFVGRIGDLIIGDHLGKPTSWALAFTYHGGNLSGFTDCGTGTCTELLNNGQTLEVTRHGATLFGAAGEVLQRGVGVHQTALYDFFSTFLLFLVLWLLVNRKPRREGVLIAGFAVWYGIGRVVEDFLRVDKRFFGLTGSQWSGGATALIALIALVVWWVRYRWEPAQPTAVPAGPGVSAPTTRFTPPREPGG